MELPKKITPDPIIEAVAEIRFDSVLPSDAVFGIIFNLFKEKFPKLEKLPTLQIPSHIRDNDPKLKIQPLYRLSNQNYILQVGPKICSLAIKNQYMGWENMLDEIVGTFSVINKNNIIKTLERIALRYIDFFNLDIFEKIKLEIKEDSKEISKKQTYFKNIIISEPFQMLVQVGKDLTMKKDRKILSGSIIDVDTQLIKVDNSDLDKLKEHFKAAHDLSKTYFFQLLKDDFLKSLNPEYDE